MYQEIELISKRNKVLRVKDNENTYIRKVFSNEESFKRELEIVTFLKDKSSQVPEIIEVNENEIIYEDLGDETLLQWLEDSENKGITNYENIIKDLLYLINELHSLLKYEFKEELVLFDMNFRNFIIFEGKIYRVDFEQVRGGSIHSDLGKLLAFLMNYYPSHSSWKKTLRESFIEKLKGYSGIDITEILRYEEEENKEMKIRRGKE